MEMQKSGRVQSRNTLQKPLFDRLFCVLALFSSIDLVQKCAAIFLGTDIEQDWARSGGRRVPVLDLENVSQPASSSKNRSATKSQILLTTRLMSTSGALTHLHSLEIAPSAQKFEYFCIDLHCYTLALNGLRSQRTKLVFLNKKTREHF